MSLWLQLSPIVFCAVTYAIIHRMRKHIPNYEAKLTTLQICSFQLLQIVYVPVSTSLFQLVNCRTIKDKGAYVNVLLNQGNIECYSWWQVSLLVYICVAVVPYFASLYVGTFFLRKQKIKQFYIVSFIPMSTVYFYIRHICCGMEDGRKAQRKEIAEQITVGNESSIKLESSSHTGEKGKKGVYNKENNKDPSEILLQMIQQPYKCEYWPSMQLLRNLIIVAIYMFIAQVEQRLTITVVVLIAYVVLLARKKPFKDSVMNWQETVNMSALLFLGIISIFESTTLYSATDNIKSLLDLLQLVRLVILFLPFPLLLIFTLIDKSQHKQNKKSIIIFIIGFLKKLISC